MLPKLNSKHDGTWNIISSGCKKLILIPSAIVLLFNCSDSLSTQKEADEKQPIEPTPIAMNSKKGFGITTKKDNGWVEKIEALNVSWHYSWGNELKDEEPDSVEFVPMIWGAWGDFSGLETKVANIKKWGESGKVNYLLGFNEPDNKNQSNMTVEKAISAWPELMESGLPLGSPGCVHADRRWMQDFMSQADEKGLDVDFVTVHWYGGANASAFINYVKKVHEMYERPIWITEFAVADWKAENIDQNRFSKREIKTFMKQVLPQLDRIAFVERYAWFSASTQSSALGNSALFDSKGNLTELGRYYSKYQ